MKFLGPFGFFYHQKEDINFLGNQGFKDQQLALQWVVEEIKNFGGDPSKVKKLSTYFFKLKNLIINKIAILLFNEYIVY